MKDAVITLRVPRRTRQRIEHLARAEGRSLSQQVERLIDQAFTARQPISVRSPRTRTLADALSGGRVPTLADFRAVRRDLTAALQRRSRRE